MWDGSVTTAIWVMGAKACAFFVLVPVQILGAVAHWLAHRLIFRATVRGLAG